MKRLVLSFALLASCAWGGTPLSPPPGHDFPYDGPLTVHTVDRANVWAECSRNGATQMRRDVAGCAFVEPTHCTIYLAARTRRAPLDAILQHELDHCGGWARDHSVGGEGR